MYPFDWLAYNSHGYKLTMQVHFKNEGLPTGLKN